MLEALFGLLSCSNHANRAGFSVLFLWIFHIFEKVRSLIIFCKLFPAFAQALYLFLKWFI